MSDHYVQLANFKWGLDTRRSKLLEQPGALVQCTNAHINSGGEVEQRMSFAKNANAFPATTFGLEATASGLVTFGSAAAPGTLPTGVTYRRCDHPTGYKAGGVAAAMTAVLGSCNYEGNAFVVATFDDGNTFCYYGDVSPMPLVSEIKRNGTVLYNAGGVETTTNLATDLTTILNTITGFTAVAGFDENGIALANAVILKTEPGIHSGFVPSETSAAGELQAALIDQNVTGNINQPASTSFLITAGAGGNTIEVTAPANSNGTGTANLTGGTLAWAGSAAATASAVVAAINARTTTTGYTAVLGTGAFTNKVIVKAPISWGALANVLVVTVNLVGITTATSQVSLSVVCSPNPVHIPAYGQSVVNAIVTGIVGSASYVWSIVVQNGITTLFTQGNASTTIGILPAATNGTAVMKVIVTDSGTAATASATFTVIRP